MSMKQLLITGAAIGLLSACEKPVDFDLRDMAKGFDTSQAVADMPSRPRPDDRGVISYPNYQVVVAQRDDTITSIAGRLGLNAAALATHNGIGADVKLRRDELIALPTRVAEPTPATGAAAPAPKATQLLDVTAIATTALDRAGPQTPVAAPVAANTPIVQTGAEPVQHRVARGETIYTAARLYNVPVKSVVEWNGIGPDLAVREGQILLVPQSTATAAPTQTAPAPAPIPTPVEPAPGTGSPTPVPPSATLPLPDETPSKPVAAPAAPAPDLGPTTAASAPATNANAQFVYPVSGAIIRSYAAGRNEGIDIGASAGSTVKAAGGGSVAAVTTDTSGGAIVVIKHDGGLLTVYTNLSDVTVAKGASVSKGQAIGKIRAGDPSFLHFEVRRGLTSADPADFLP
jgi:lipoprotein NlpD